MFGHLAIEFYTTTTTKGLTMAVPKRKMSRSRTRRRKAEAMKMRPVRTSACQRCGEPKLPHRACKSGEGCGTYRGRSVFQS